MLAPLAEIVCGQASGVGAPAAGFAGAGAAAAGAGPATASPAWRQAGERPVLFCFRQASAAEPPVGTDAQ